ncbi:MAG: prepilin-type N-terminal cleavage/methylation domain-containing protein [Limnohabitans sp.]|jgi:prepilin-type N-terminal cleavage/methylation domain-containing protein|uniref:type II secretion system protein n=1 Tax=Limnohabitans sp. TaxID=1907725 RepID=UPI0025D4243F|nr:prepilin-type N-terminal cleavage/methylation domain-containing protein [Limnohabitans sp.]MCO4087442.1 prepilin-type N-terminal cleavage/methylation domain-containing protein [Limnohabitans sp.]
MKPPQITTPLKRRMFSATSPICAGITQPAQKRAHKQKGFTLMELAVVLGIIAVLASVIIGSFSGDSSKATKLLADMTTIGNSVNRAKMELGGVPSRLSVLWNRTDAVAGNMFNGITATTTWGGPYVERQPVDASNNITVSTVADAATISINREAASAANGGNYTWVYFLRASNVPNPIITEYIKKCAGTDAVATVTFANGKCRATLGTGATEFGTVDMKITDSR